VGPFEHSQDHAFQKSRCKTIAIPSNKKGAKKGGNHSSFALKAHAVVMLWRIISESREGGRPGITADAAYKKVTTDPHVEAIQAKDS
jgi:hypothetical protein